MATAVYIVEGMSVRKLELNISMRVMDLLTNWRNHGPNRIVYAHMLPKHKAYPYYILNGKVGWVVLPKKPDVLQMADLIDSVGKFTLVELENEIKVQTHPLFREQ